MAFFSPLTSCALMTARSVTGSVPTTVASADVPSLKVTEMLPSADEASPTTWLLVRISPSDDSTMPVPSPPPCAVRTWIDTTLGSTAAATASTEPSAAGVSLLAAVPVSEVPPVAAGDWAGSSRVLVSAAPAPPPTSPAASATAASRATPRRGRALSASCSGAGGGVPGGSPEGSGARQGS